MAIRIIANDGSTDNISWRDTSPSPEITFSYCCLVDFTLFDTTIETVQYFFQYRRTNGGLNERIKFALVPHPTITNAWVLEGRIEGNTITGVTPIYAGRRYSAFHQFDNGNDLMELWLKPHGLAREFRDASGTYTGNISGTGAHATGVLCRAAFNPTYNLNGIIHRCAVWHAQRSVNERRAMFADVTPLNRLDEGSKSYFWNPMTFNAAGDLRDYSTGGNNHVLLDEGGLAFRDSTLTHNLEQPVLGIDEKWPWVGATGGAAAQTAITSLEAAVLKQQALAASLDSALQSSAVKTLALDAALAAVKTALASLNAALAGNFSEVVSLDGALKAGATRPADIDAALQAARLALASLDAGLADRRTRSAGLEAAIETAASLSSLIDAALQLDKSGLADLDAALLVAESLEASIDAALRVSQAESLGLDGSLIGATAVATSLEAAVQQAKALLTGLDAALQGEMSATAELDAALRAGKSVAASLAAAIMAVRLLGTGLDASITGAMAATIAANLDGALLKARGLTALIDAALAQEVTGDAVFDAGIALSLEAGALVDAAIARAGQLSAALDVALMGLASVSAGLDALIGGQFRPSKKRTLSVPTRDPHLVPGGGRTVRIPGRDRKFKMH